MRSPCVNSPKAGSNGDARMNQKPTPVASGRPTAALNSPKWRTTRPSVMPNTTSLVVGSSPQTGSDQKRVPFSPGVRTNSNTTEITTPVKSFLNSNITPRSSSRKARKGSASSTPNDSPNVTPRNSRPSSMIEPHEKLPEDHSTTSTGQGVRKRNTGGMSKPSSVVSDSQKSNHPLRPKSRERNLYGNAISPSLESQPKFFHADDVRPTLQTIPSERFIMEEKSSRAKAGRLKDHSSEISHQDSIITLQARRPKFCYADGTSESTTVPLQLATRTTIRSPTIATQQAKRATSPLKDEILSRESSFSMPSARRHTRNVSNTPAAFGQDIRQAEPLSVGHSNTSRRSSISTLSQRRVSHAKSSSVSAVSSISGRRPTIELSDGACMNSLGSHPAAENGTPVEARLPSPSLSDPLSSKSTMTLLLSPKLSPNKLEHANELAADARRERKVLDLEISNSSLLAINQTLEREMRKQQAELRRLRRQSQFGRISEAQSFRSGPKRIGELSEIDDSTNMNRLAGQSSPPVSIEDEDDEDGDDKGFPSKRSFSSSNSHSDDGAIPTSHATLRDSKRLYLGYSRHRALLIDGQRMNQSIERCLGRSEDLIAAGKKALDYRVDVHELESLTGRVLIPDELEETGMWGPGQGLLSPGTSQREMSWEEQGDGDGPFNKSHEGKKVKILDVNDRQSLEEGEIYPESEMSSVRESYLADQESDPELPNGWDSIKADVQTPDELPIIGIQNIRGYLSTFEHNLQGLI